MSDLNKPNKNERESNVLLQMLEPGIYQLTINRPKIT